MNVERQTSSPVPQNAGTKDADRAHIGLQQQLADFISSQKNGVSADDVLGIMQETDVVNGKNYQKQAQAEKWADSNGNPLTQLENLSPEDAMAYCLDMAGRQLTSAGKEMWTNFANYYQTTMLRDYDNNYNRSSAQLQRLMAAGLSRQAAMAALQGTESNTQATPLQSQAPSIASEVIGNTAQVASMVSSLSTAGVNIGQLMQMPHLIRGAKSQADLLEFAARNAEYEQNGRVFANEFSKAVYASAAKQCEETGQPFDPTQITSLAKAKELVAWGKDNGVSEAMVYDACFKKQLEGNLYGQSLCQKGYDGWVSTKDFDPMEDTQPIMREILNQEVQQRVADVAATYAGTYKAYADIALIAEEMEYLDAETDLAGAQAGLTRAQTLTEAYVQKMTSAQTACLWSQKDLNDVAKRMADAEYDLFSEHISPAEAARYQAQSDYYKAYNMQHLIRKGDKTFYKGTGGQLAGFSDADNAGMFRYMNQQRMLYLVDPAGWDKQNANNPTLMANIHDYSGYLNSMAKSAGIDLTEAQTANTKVNTVIAPINAATGGYMNVGFGYSGFKSAAQKEFQMGMMLSKPARVGFGAP